MTKQNKKTKIYSPLCIIILCLPLIGCKKGWLEEKSDKALTVPATLIDFQGLLDDFTTMGSLYPSNGEFAADGHYVTEAIFQNTTISAYLHQKDAYTWSKNSFFTAIPDWNRSYAKILIDNIVLDGLVKIQPNDELELTQRNDIKGQALFHRARVFFELAQLYALPYNKDSDNEYGIVLRLSSDITAASKRSTVKETYDQIINDLKEALILLPDKGLYPTRGSKAAVHALLSKVYLSQSDYENAYKAADNCLKLYDQLLDYNDISASASFIGRYNKEVISHSNFIPGFNLTSQLIDPAFFSLYHVSDLRRTRFFRQNSNGTISFKGNYDSVTSNYFCGLATDEIYLIRAECHARAGRLIEALKDLNDLLIKRWDKNVPYPIVTLDDAQTILSTILLERRKELIYRGTRWTDLRRLNKDPQFAVSLTKTISGQIFTLEPNSYKYTFPVPDDIIQQTGIQQNPGWP